MASNRKKAAYDIAYIKANYKRVVLNCRPADLAALDDLAAAAGLSRSAAILAAARYCLRSLSPEELRALALDDLARKDLPGVPGRLEDAAGADPVPAPAVEGSCG